MDFRVFFLPDNVVIVIIGRYVGMYIFGGVHAVKT